jgi:hypothetical protein
MSKTIILTAVDLAVDPTASTMYLYVSDSNTPVESGGPGKVWCTLMFKITNGEKITKNLMLSDAELLLSLPELYTSLHTRAVTEWEAS